MGVRARAPRHSAGPPLARALAQRLSVASLDRVVTRSEARLETALALRCGRRLRIVYECRGGLLRYDAALDSKDAARPPAKVLAARK